MSYILVVIALILPYVTFAQLPAFQIIVTPVSESCSGNGSVTISATGTVTGASLAYSVFRLPDTINQVAGVTNGNFIGGLTSGSYQLVATQSANNQSNTQQTQFIITDETSPLLFTAETTPANCGTNGSITIVPSSGTAVSMEIINGPVIVGNQTSLTVNSLPEGIYSVRVFDNCNQGFVQTVTVLPSAVLLLNTQTSVNQQLETCNSITLKNSLSNADNLLLTYPYNVVYTIFPPNGGTPIVIPSQILTGDPLELQLSTVIPYYSGETYFYDISITDGCSNISTFNNIELNGNFGASLNKRTAPCGDYFISFAVNNFLPPVTIDFIQYPADFDPLDFNSSDPASFAGLPITYGSPSDPVPFGLYRAIVSDSCGRSATVSRNILYLTPVPDVTVEPLAGCESFKSNVNIKVEDYNISSAIIQSGPTEFSTSYPVNVSNFIVSGVVKLSSLITGIYQMVVIDTCGNSYIVDFTVPPLAPKLTVEVSPGCELGKASLRITGNATQLVSVILDNVVPSNGLIFPTDLSTNINIANPDIFSINDLLPGTYTFTIQDNCGVTHTETVDVDGYEITQNTYQIDSHCGTFDLTLNHLSNSAAPQFWLQKRNPVTGEWGHPETNVVMAPGENPTDLNGFPLMNENTTYNIGFSGHFRIIKLSAIYENGNIGLIVLCPAILQEFDYISVLAITNIGKLACGGATSDVFVVAEGTPPLNYRISTKDGAPFVVDNGTNNMFLNLAPGVYNFEVVDSCGNILNQLADVARLPTRVDITSVEKLSKFIECDQSDNDGQALFNLSDLDQEIMAGALPGNYVITYYTTLLNATSGVNALATELYSSSTTLFIRIAYANSLNCFDITSVDLLVNPYPLVLPEQTRTICLGEQTTLTAPPGFESYLWSTGEITESINVSEIGDYTFTITQTNNGVTCSGTYSIKVVNPESPVILDIITADWTDDQNSITVILESNPQNFLYSIDNINFQTENVFPSLQPGEYTIYIRNLFGCDEIEQQVFLLGYPKFFTPNADGYNDFWNIPHASSQEPNMKIYIFDRFGKLLKMLDGDSLGWDGTFNNQPLPSTDYWFYLIRENGTEKRGHFSLKR